MADKVNKPIDINTISDQIDNVIKDYCATYNIDLYDYNKRINIKHNEVNNILRTIYKDLFKPVNNKILYNRKSLLDYDNIELMSVIVDKFIDICLLFNKSLGLQSFSIMTGVKTESLERWENEGNANPAKYHLVKSIKECNRTALVSLLKDSTVGQIAVANNDKDTGLEWAKNQQQIGTQNNVYYIPSDRVDRLKLEALGNKQPEPVTIDQEANETV